MDLVLAAEVVGRLPNRQRQHLDALLSVGWVKREAGELHPSHRVAPARPRVREVGTVRPVVLADGVVRREVHQVAAERGPCLLEQLAPLVRLLAKVGESQGLSPMSHHGHRGA